MFRDHSLRDVLQQAYDSLKFNRSRTGLTMLGMAWGIATVVLLLAYGAGFGRAVHNIFETWGVKVIGVFGGRTSMQAGGVKAGTQIRFTSEDVDRIVAAVPMVRHITPVFWKNVKLQAGERTLDANATGAAPVYQRIRTQNVVEGRYYT